MKIYILNYNHLAYKFSRTQPSMLSNTWPIIIHLNDFKIITYTAAYSRELISNLFVTKQ